MIIQNIITEEDEWKAHTGDYYSASKRDKALKKKQETRNRNKRTRKQETGMSQETGNRN